LIDQRRLTEGRKELHLAPDSFLVISPKQTNHTNAAIWIPGITVSFASRPVTMSETQAASAAPSSYPRGRGRGRGGQGFRGRGRGGHRERGEETTASDSRRATERGNTPVPGASSEVSHPAPAGNDDSGFSRGRGGRGGRGRGARGDYRGRGERVNDDARTGQAVSVPVDEAPEASSVNGDEGSWRGRRRGRGGISGQRSVVVSHRGRERPTPAAVPSGAGGLSGAGLSAAAAEFVPGQPVASSR
jgi:hypothetical protein